MRIIIHLIICLFLGLSLCSAEEETVLEPKVAQYDFSAIPKDPLASCFFSATFPGAGQIYNKEYKRGIITGIGFWSSLIIVNYLLYYRLVEINTETFYIEDTFGNLHKVEAQKDLEDWEGLPRAEQALLITSTLVMAGSYIWGIIDSYRGAKRYNKKLFTQNMQKLDLDFAYIPRQEKVKLTANYRF